MGQVLLAAVYVGYTVSNKALNELRANSQAAVALYRVCAVFQKRLFKSLALVQLQCPRNGQSQQQRD